MRVKEIVIDGFKSYAKRTVITNWDGQFNCITGLNGSGKSNILDAICFVLGITTMSTVRAQNQQDLIYKRGQAGVTKASVSIVFDNSDKSKSPLDYRQVDTITVTRQVVLGGTSKYLVNGHRAQQAQVQQLFQEVQLNVNNPNFLIMQGQITKVVNMRPTEILGLIEEAAGTGMYEKERLKAIKEIHDRDVPLHETESLLNEEVRPKLEKLRSQKRQFLEYQQCAASTESLEKVLAASEYNFYRQKLRKLEAEDGEQIIKAENLKAELEVGGDRCAALERSIAELRAEQQSEEIAKLDSELQLVSEEHTRAATDLEHKQQQLESLDTQAASNKRVIDELSAKLNAYEQSVQTFEQKHSQLRAQFDEQHNIVEERRELLSGLQTGISTSGAKETGYAYASKRARENVASAKQLVQSLEADRQRLEASLSEGEAEELRTRLADFLARFEEIKQTETEKQERLTSLAGAAKKASELKAQQQAVRDEVSRLNRELERLMARYPNLDIPQNNHQVKGRVAHVFQVLESHRNKSLALEVCGGGGIWSLVVENEKVGAAVLKSARKRMTVLPLNRMRSQVIKRDIVKQIDEQGAWLAIDLLGFDEDVRPAVEYVFGRTVVCATSRIAERAAFQFGVRSVTLEGDIYDPRGVISGGFQGVRDHSKGGSGASSIFNAVAQYQSLVQQRIDAEAQLRTIEASVKDVGQSALIAEQIQNELVLVAHEAQLAEGRTTDCRNKLEQITEVERALEELRNSKLPSAESSLASAQALLEKALKDTLEFNANKEGKLKELKAELTSAVAREAELGKQLELQASQHSQNQSELTRLRSDLAQEERDRSGYEQSTEELRGSIHSLMSCTIPELNSRIAQLEAALKEMVSRQTSSRQDMQSKEQELINLQARVAEMRLELQQASHSQEKHKELLSQAKASLNQVLKKWSWAPDVAATYAGHQPQDLQRPRHTISASHPTQGGEVLEFAQDPTDTADDASKLHQLEQLRQNFSQEQRRLQSLASRVDSSVVTMIERLETDEAQLRQRLETIREDRRKLEESMNTLNERRRVTIDKVWQQVSRDFGLIFGDLLPNSSCELVPLSDQPIKNGFSLRVRLGETWKDGLTELSGGQRSLVALALILALLRYHPAPVYILDEVDAALDVHHTRNIGHIIKTRFQNAQFIVVSLKDDMFTNANRIYQTRFIDGTSTVAIVA